MRVIDPGHTYELKSLDGGTPQRLSFVKRLIVPGRTDHHPGTTCQDVLCALIDRTQVLDAEIPWHGNADIIQHLRMAIALYEGRALVRKVEKKLLKPELVECLDTVDGHFLINTRPRNDDGTE